MIRAVLTVVALIVLLDTAQLLVPLPEVAPDVGKEHRDSAHSVTFPIGVKSIPRAVYWKPAGYCPFTLDLYLPLHESMGIS